MIRLDIKEYCSNCLDFEPDIIKSERFYQLGLLTPDEGCTAVTQSDTIVRCKYSKRCEAIKRYLEQQLKGGSNEELV